MTKDVYVTFSKTGYYEVLNNGIKMANGIIETPGGYVCLSDIAKSLYTTSMYKEKCIHHAVLTVRFNASDGTTPFLVVSFKNEYYKGEPLTQNWCYENTHYC